MSGLGLIHLIYVLMVVVILVTMALRKDIIIPCVLGLFLIGMAASGGNVISALQVMFNALIVSGTELWSTIVIISLIIAMSKSLQDLGADEIMLAPIKKLMVNKYVSFFVLGLIMAVISFAIWPSPAVALIGAILLPAAVRSKLPAIWAAVAMNLFGHGLALSGDFFINGAPVITANGAGLDSTEIVRASIPLWIVMGVTTIATASFMLIRDLGKTPEGEDEIKQAELCEHPGAKTIAILTIAVFLVDLALMQIFSIRGGDASALVGGSVMILMAVASIVRYGVKEALEKSTDYIRSGFMFGIKIFSPVIVIGGLFFLGGEGTAKQILGENATGILNDIGIFLAQSVPLSKAPVVLVQAAIGFVTGLDGSGFSGLPLVGSVAATFSNAITIDKAGLAALGQIITIWVGGGTIIPWAVIPVAAMCNISAVELARKNFIPVAAGICATVLAAFILL
ncbi:MAG: hypothetical protein LBU32_32835 [Clostridiales bacterium]|jgi:hypothetical protein|nr:hypothetical protein [Clostridiales bacterium]